MRRLVLSISAAIASVAIVLPTMLAASGTPSASPAELEANKAVVRHFWDALNNRNLDALDMLVATNFTDHMPFPGTSSDREGLKQTVRQFWAAFPDAEWTIEDVVAEGDIVVARLTFRGTHQDEIFGVPPTGREVTIAGIIFYQVVDGQIVGQWAVRDILGLLQQLGAIPAPAATPAR